GGLHSVLKLLIDHLDDPMIGAELMARFELNLLEELGFGLDLAACAATGATEALVYVSPRSGRAVSRDAGAPWADRLLALPEFLPGTGLADCDELDEAFRLTGHCLARHVWEARGTGEPPSRAAFIAAVLRSLG